MGFDGTKNTRDVAGCSEISGPRSSRSRGVSAKSGNVAEAQLLNVLCIVLQNNRRNLLS